MISVKKIVDEAGIQYTKDDLSLLGCLVRNKFRKIFRKDPQKLPVEEDGELIQVNHYPESFKELMLDVIIDYFTHRTHYKQIMAHSHRLKEQKKFWDSKGQK